MHQPSTHFSSSPSLNISSVSVPSPLTVGSIPAFDNNKLGPQASLNRLQQLIGLLDSSLRLPDSPRAFMIFLVGLAIIFAGAFLHVLVAAQIMQAEFRVTQLQEQYRALEQQNGDLIFEIAHTTNYSRLYERVIAAGYVPVKDREYVFLPSESLADVEMANERGQESATTMSDATTSVTPSLATQLPKPTFAPLNLDSMNWSGGQFARWEEFWKWTWQSATGTGSNTPPTLMLTRAASDAETSNSATGFWSTWWERTSDQGSKLLDQLQGQ